MAVNDINKPRGMPFQEKALSKATVSPRIVYSDDLCGHHFWSSHYPMIPPLSISPTTWHNMQCSWPLSKNFSTKIIVFCWFLSPMCSKILQSPHTHRTNLLMIPLSVSFVQNVWDFAPKPCCDTYNRYLSPIDIECVASLSTSKYDVEIQTIAPYDILVQNASPIKPLPICLAHWFFFGWLFFF